MKLNLWIVAIALSTLVSCSSSKSGDPTPTGSTGTTGTTGKTSNLQPGVYAVGNVATTPNVEGRYQANIWINGKSTMLSTANSLALGITTHNDDVYVVGANAIQNYKPVTG